MGLVEDAWLDTLATIDPEELEYVDYVIRGQELAHYLKVEQVIFFFCLESILCNVIRTLQVSKLQRPECYLLM